MSTSAIPLLLGKPSSNCPNAVDPPAGAPMPRMGKRFGTSVRSVGRLSMIELIEPSYTVVRRFKVGIRRQAGSIVDDTTSPGSASILGPPLLALRPSVVFAETSGNDNDCK